MKKSLWLFAICLGLNSFCAWAQDDDVYFVPSSKDKTEEVEESYDMAPSSYTPITDDERFAESDWAKGRGNGKWDVDAYNRRGKHYKGGCNDSLKKEKSCYDQGYEDGYADGRYTSRIVRFYSPRPGIYVSSPYYLDFYDICYDPWYYGYASPWSWSWGWSGWYGWGSWYGWRPYYSWHSGWYDPWWGPSFGWYPHYGHGSHWIPANAQRGPVGGYVAYGGRRGSNGSYSSGRRGSYSSRPSSAFGTGRREGWRGNAVGTSGHRPSRSFGNSNRPSRSYGNSNRTNSNRYNNDRPSRSFDSNRSMQRSNFSQPSRGSFDRGSSFGGGRSGGGRSFGGGGRGRR